MDMSDEDSGDQFRRWTPRGEEDINDDKSVGDSISDADGSQFSSENGDETVMEEGSDGKEGIDDGDASGDVEEETTREVHRTGHSKRPNSATHQGHSGGLGFHGNHMHGNNSHFTLSRFNRRLYFSNFGPDRY